MTRGEGKEGKGWKRDVRDRGREERSEKRGEVGWVDGFFLCVSFS